MVAELAGLDLPPDGTADVWWARRQDVSDRHILDICLEQVYILCLAKIYVWSLNLKSFILVSKILESGSNLILEI